MWITLVAAFVYCAWLGAHWLPLGMSDKELAASASRVWDIQREIVQHHSLPWWTPYYMSGSSYGLNHARGFYLIPWMLFSTFTDLLTAGKLTALTAIFASGIAMYFCARHLLKSEWAAVLAALAFMMHPEQIIRAAGAEHITISLFFPFIPLFWLTFARALDSQRFRDAFWCALVVMGAMWTDNKQAVIQCVFLTGYLLYWLGTHPEKSKRIGALKSCVLIGATTLTLSAFIIVPGLVESKYVKLFAGDPLPEWQKNYAFKSLFGIVDRNGVISTQAREGVRQAGVRSQEELEKANRLIAATITDAPEKYAGLVWLAIVALTTLFNHRRENRWLFWTFIALLLLSVMLATGLTNVWSANTTTLSAWLGLNGVPSSATGAAWLALIAVGGFLVIFWRRKLTTSRKRAIAGGALAVFLFLPAFQLLARLPYFKEVRAPYTFYDGPEVFLGAILAGFFVTDVLSAQKWRARIPVIVGSVVALMLIDYWPYEKPMKETNVPAHTLQNLRASYGSLQSDKDWVKTYSLTGRYFHLLGPMYGGKPQVYEAFYNWMSPLGTGLLHQQASSSWENHRAFLNLMAARYVVFDKSDPNNAQQGSQQILGAYRQNFPVTVENEDFVVFRNDNARPYVSAYGRACLFDGELRDSPRLALALDARNWLLVHASARADAAGKYENVYRDANAPPPLRDGELVPLTDVQLTRENAQRIRIYLNAPRDCFAVVSESYYPFWGAEVDGKPVEVFRVSCGLMGIELPAGGHEIVLRYQTPRAYTVAGIVSVLSLAIGLGATIRSSRASRP